MRISQFKKSIRTSSMISVLLVSIITNVQLTSANAAELSKFDGEYALWFWYDGYKQNTIYFIIIQNGQISSPHPYIQSPEANDSWRGTVDSSGAVNFKGYCPTIEIQDKYGTYSGVFNSDEIASGTYTCLDGRTDKWELVKTGGSSPSDDNKSGNNNEKKELLDTAIKLLNEKRFEQAISYFMKVISIDPSDLNAIFGIGIAYHNLKKYDKAIEWYDKVISIDPNFSNVQEAKAKALSSLNSQEKLPEKTDIMINFDTKLPKAKRDIVSDHTRKILNDILKNTSVKSIKITSTIRTADELARIMYDNLVGTGKNQGIAAQYKLYGPNGDKIIKVYEEMRKTVSDPTKIKEAMKNKIIEIGGEKISRHAMSTSNYNKYLNTIDIAPSSITDKAGFEKAMHDAMKRGDIFCFITPNAGDPAYHIEIPQTKNIPRSLGKCNVK